MSKYAVCNPATGQVVETFPSATDEEVAAAVASAARAYAEWGRTSSVAERAAAVRRVAELHRERRRRAREGDQPRRWARRSPRPRER